MSNETIKLVVTPTHHYLRRRAEKMRKELQATLGPHSRYAYRVEKATRGPYRWRVEKVRIRK